MQISVGEYVLGHGGLWRGGLQHRISKPDEMRMIISILANQASEFVGEILGQDAVHPPYGGSPVIPAFDTQTCFMQFAAVPSGGEDALCRAMAWLVLARFLSAEKKAAPHNTMVVDYLLRVIPSIRGLISNPSSGKVSSEYLTIHEPKTLGETSRKFRLTVPFPVEMMTLMTDPVTGSCMMGMDIMFGEDCFSMTSAYYTLEFPSTMNETHPFLKNLLDGAENSDTYTGMAVGSHRMRVNNLGSCIFWNKV